mmetsp:Transcript_62898/g.164939  ORF Transcript_62898/g.164939 Transcript_62898/m.164939 type:complete len:416 (+) Transcript_62898:140-1387(+)
MRLNPSAAWARRWACHRGLLQYSILATIGRSRFTSQNPYESRRDGHHGVLGQLHARLHAVQAFVAQLPHFVGQEHGLHLQLRLRLEFLPAIRPHHGSSRSHGVLDPRVHLRRHVGCSGWKMILSPALQQHPASVFPHLSGVDVDKLLCRPEAREGLLALPVEHTFVQLFGRDGREGVDVVDKPTAALLDVSPDAVGIWPAHQLLVQGPIHDVDGVNTQILLSLILLHVLLNHGVAVDDDGEQEVEQHDEHHDDVNEHVGRVGDLRRPAKTRRLLEDQCSREELELDPLIRRHGLMLLQGGPEGPVPEDAQHHEAAQEVDHEVEDVVAAGDHRVRQHGQPRVQRHVKAHAQEQHDDQEEADKLQQVQVQVVVHEPCDCPEVLLGLVGLEGRDQLLGLVRRQAVQDEDGADVNQRQD